jgi:hypothetical protein
MQAAIRPIVAFILFNSAMALLVLAVHLWPGNNSMLNLNSWEHMNPKKGLNEAYLEEVIAYHQTEPTFARRPITTQAVLGLHRSTGVSKAQSFLLFNFGILWLTGIVLSLLAHSQSKNVKSALLSGLMFWLSFPVLFAFFPTIYSYDDPLLYLFLALILVAIRRNKVWAAATFFSLAIITRESAVIMLPGIVILLNDGLSLKNLKSSWKKWGPFLSVAIFYLVAFVLLTYGHAGQSFSQDASRRFATLFFNFQNKQFAIESILSLILVCSLAFFSWKDNREHAVHRQAFMITLVINSTIVFLFTQARESRLFMLPLFFWLPFAGPLLMQAWGNFRAYLQHGLSWKTAVLFAFAALFYGFVAFIIYQPTAMLPHENWHQEYLFVLLIFTALISYSNPRFLKS